MTHLTIDQLTDHLLGTDAQQRDDRVDSHLATGCARCNRLLAQLAQVRRVGQLDGVFKPPDSAVRAAKALSGVVRSRRGSRPAKMRLSFDSFLSPAQVGARSLQASSRHLVFYSQNFALDLRMDFGRSVRDMVIVGQLLNRDCGPLADVPAYLVTGDRVVSHSTTGRLGEFHMECRPGGPMHLRLLVNDDELIDVELDRRHQKELKPTLVDRDDLAEPLEAPAAIHSRTSGIEQ
jgi:hypothetical protein